MGYITDDPPEVIELTQEEFDEATARALASIFPDLAPCCRKERRNFDGWCLSCDDPCF